MISGQIGVVFTPNDAFEAFTAPPRANCSSDEREAFERYVEQKFYDRIAETTPLSKKQCDDLAKRWSLDFIDFYTMKGWKVGKSRMENVNSAISLWTRRNLDDKKSLVHVPATVTTYNPQEHNHRSARAVPPPKHETH